MEVDITRPPLSKHEFTINSEDELAQSAGYADRDDMFMKQRGQTYDDFWQSNFGDNGDNEIDEGWKYNAYIDAYNSAKKQADDAAEAARQAAAAKAKEDADIAAQEAADKAAADARAKAISAFGGTPEQYDAYIARQKAIKEFGGTAAAYDAKIKSDTDAANARAAAAKKAADAKAAADKQASESAQDTADVTSWPERRNPSDAKYNYSTEWELYKSHTPREASKTEERQARDRTAIEAWYQTKTEQEEADRVKRYNDSVSAALAQKDADAAEVVKTDIAGVEAQAALAPRFQAVRAFQDALQAKEHIKNYLLHDPTRKMFIDRIIGFETAYVNAIEQEWHSQHDQGNDQTFGSVFKQAFDKIGNEITDPNSDFRKKYLPFVVLAMSAVPGLQGFAVLISLASSIQEVAGDPNDPMKWLDVVGSVAGGAELSGVKTLAKIGKIAHEGIENAKDLLDSGEGEEEEEDEEAPEEEAPEEEAPEEEAPEEEVPEKEAPEEEVPEKEAPEEEAPETEAPEAEAPEPEAPDEEAPEEEAPEADVPEEEETENADMPDEAGDINAADDDEPDNDAGGNKPSNKMRGKGGPATSKDDILKALAEAQASLMGVDKINLGDRFFFQQMQDGFIPDKYKAELNKSAASLARAVGTFYITPPALFTYKHGDSFSPPEPVSSFYEPNVPLSITVDDVDTVASGQGKPKTWESEAIQAQNRRDHNVAMRVSRKRKRGMKGGSRESDMQRERERMQHQQHQERAQAMREHARRVEHAAENPPAPAWIDDRDHAQRMEDTEELNEQLRQSRYDPGNPYNWQLERAGHNARLLRTGAQPSALADPDAAYRSNLARVVRDVPSGPARMQMKKVTNELRVAPGVGSEYHAAASRFGSGKESTSSDWESKHGDKPGESHEDRLQRHRALDNGVRVPFAPDYPHYEAERAAHKDVVERNLAKRMNPEQQAEHDAANLRGRLEHIREEPQRAAAQIRLEQQRAEAEARRRDFAERNAYARRHAAEIRQRHAPLDPHANPFPGVGGPRPPGAFEQMMAADRARRARPHGEGKPKRQRFMEGFT